MNIITQKLVTKWRRELHKIPELSLSEYKTKEYLKGVLDNYNIPYEEVLDTGIVVTFLGEHKDEREKTILFRADIDALPIEEENNIDFKSEHKGIMHACGHDGHTTILLGTLLEIYNIYKNTTVTQNTIFVFQPAEERLGGAELIQREFDFSKYNIVGSFALHLNPDYEEGTIISKKDYIMADATEIIFDIQGDSAHVGLKHKGVDALNAATILYTELLKINSLNLNAKDFNIIHIGKIEAGMAANIVPNKATLMGTTRTLTKENYKLIMKHIEKIVSGVEIITNTKINIDITTHYESVFNDEKLYEIIKKVCIDSDIKYIELPETYLYGEDFSSFRKISPINYSFLGVRNEVKGYTSGLHTPKFNFDESVLMTGIKYFISIFNSYEKNKNYTNNF